MAPRGRFERKPFLLLLAALANPPKKRVPIPESSPFHVLDKIIA